MSGAGSPSFGKLLRLREWITVPEAARHLTNLFEEEVSEADVLRLALDGHLVLSVSFVNHGRGKCGPVVALEHAKRFELPVLPGDFASLGMAEGDVGWFVGLEGLSLGNGRVFEPTDEVASLEGIWDLTMHGAERLDVEHRFQFLTGGPAVDLVAIDGPILCQPDGTHCQVQAHFKDNEFHNPENLKKPWDHPDNFYPAGSLPSDAVFVVRTTEVQRLVSRLSERAKGADKPLERRERTTLLVVIGALAKLAKIDVTKPSSAAAAIESETERMGARVAARTIENHLKLIPDALESRGE